ncbi:MAG: leucine-rich repeat protein [Ruminococcus sp.]|nr:leucine-rich repeat protein [Ruminococcus sp.]
MKLKNRLLSGLTALAVCVGVSAAASVTASREMTVADAEAVRMTDTQTFLTKSASTYGYNSEGSRSNGTARQQFYNNLFDFATGIWADRSDFALYTEGYYQLGIVNFSSLGLNSTEAREVYYTLRNDCPLFYYLGAIAVSDKNIYLLTSEEYSKGADRAGYQRSIFDFISSSAEKAEGLSGEFAKALFVNDLLENEMDYSYVDNGSGGQKPNPASWAHNVLGAAEHGEGVCESYAKTFQALGNYIGLDTIYVLGIGNGGDHAWNMVKLDDGNYYYVDATWNDNLNGHKYFACEKSVMDENHTANTTSTSGSGYLYNLPTAPTGGYVSAAFKGVFNSYDYYVQNGYAAISAYKGSATSVSVPSSIGRWKVGSIGRAAFINNSTITSVTLPNTVEYIGINAFAACSALTKINIPASVKEIDRDAFIYDTKLNDISLPEGLETLGPGALFYVKIGSGSRSLTIPASVTSIGQYAVGYMLVSSSAGYKNDGNYPSNWATRTANFTLNVYEGSAGLAYAKANGFTYNTLKHSHSYTATVVPPTYTEQGYTEHYCAGCRDKYTDTYTDRLPRPGDWSGDGLLTDEDAELFAAWLTDGTGTAPETADVNDDGYTDTLDYSMLKAYLSGIPVLLK